MDIDLRLISGHGRFLSFSNALPSEKNIFLYFLRLMKSPFRSAIGVYLVNIPLLFLCLASRPVLPIGWRNLQEFSGVSDHLQILCC
jgi:hypothetical protein